MNNQIKIAIIRSAGLSFPIACVRYLFSGKLSAFALVLFGAGFGFMVGLIMQRNPELGAKIRAGISRSSSQPDRPVLLLKYLAHPKLIIRFVGLVVSTLLFLLAWCIGYFCLPEGVFRASADVQMARSAGCSWGPIPSLFPTLSEWLPQ